MNEVTHIFIVLLLVVLMYYAWMDVALYYKLQSQTDNLLLTQNYIEDRSNNAKYENVLLLFLLPFLIFIISIGIFLESVKKFL